jgi:hypothetical protein
MGWLSLTGTGRGLLLGGAPGPARLDQLGLEQPDRHFGQRVVVAVADAAHRGDQARGAGPVGERPRGVLGSPVPV